MRQWPPPSFSLFIFPYSLLYGRSICELYPSFPPPPIPSTLLIKKVLLLFSLFQSIDSFCYCVRLIDSSNLLPGNEKVLTFHFCHWTINIVEKREREPVNLDLEWNLNRVLIVDRSKAYSLCYASLFSCFGFMVSVLHASNIVMKLSWADTVLISFKKNEINPITTLC
jgi:hypothetical protein